MTVAGTKKFCTLVDEFVSTAAALGVPADGALAAQELEARIRAVASQIGVTEATALRSYIPDGWGKDMARIAYRDLQERAAGLGAEPSREIPAQALGLLVGALGQALLCFTINEQAEPDPIAHLIAGRAPFSPADASQAVSGLGLALAEATSDSPTVSIGGDIVVWARESLTAFADNLERGRWSSCPCQERHEHQSMDRALLRAVRRDLRLLT